jgi:hypothetical protein
MQPGAQIPTAGLRSRKKVWPHQKKWMLSGELTEPWQQAGEPSGKDDEFYHQAKKELQEALDKENQLRRE